MILYQTFKWLVYLFALLGGGAFITAMTQSFTVAILGTLVLVAVVTGFFWWDD